VFIDKGNRVEEKGLHVCHWQLLLFTEHSIYYFVIFAGGIVVSVLATGPRLRVQNSAKAMDFEGR
jgi:hypothetical protein